MKTEIIKPEFRPIVLQITLEKPADVARFRQVDFCVPHWGSQWDRELINKLRAMRDSL